MSMICAYQDFTCMAEYIDGRSFLWPPRMLHNQHQKLYAKLGIGCRDYYLHKSVHMIALPSTSILRPTKRVLCQRTSGCARACLFPIPNYEIYLDL